MRVLVAALCGAVAAGTAYAQPADPIGHPVRIGVITDMSGPLSSQAGPGAVAAVQMAAEDCLAAECAGMKIEVLSADHQNKADVAIGIVRDWFDNKGVNAVSDIVQATVQVAVQHEAASHNRIALFTGGTARLTNEDCAPATSVMWMWDTYGLTAGITRPLAKPGSKWFFITADYVFGKSLQTDATALIQAAGGKVVGAVSHPFSYPGDFSPLLLQAQASGADIIALANSGTDLVNTIKQAREFGIGTRQAVARLVRAQPAGRGGGGVAGRGRRAGERVVLLGHGRSHPGMVASLRPAERGPHADPPSRPGTMRWPAPTSGRVAAAKTTDTAAVIAKLHELPPDDTLVRNPRCVRMAAWYTTPTCSG